MARLVNSLMTGIMMSSQIAILYLLIQIHLYQNVRIFEPNALILFSEIALVGFGIIMGVKKLVLEESLE